MNHIASLRVVIQAIFREVYDNSFPGACRQYVARRQDDFGAFARQPGIHARIGRYQLQVTEIMRLGDRREGIFVTAFDHAHLADDILTRRR